MKHFHALVVGAALALTLPAAVLAAEGPAAPPAPAARAWHRHAGPMRAVLRQLDLTADQKSQMQSIHATVRPRVAALRDAARANRDALATTPPTDAAYAGLLEQSKANAAAAIQLRSDVWSQVYAVLTPEQRARVPELVAAVHARRKARAEEWATHETGPT